MPSEQARNMEFVDGENEIAKEANPASLQKIFGDSSVAKVLDFLTLYREFDYSLTEIARNSGVAWRTLSRIWSPLEQYHVVIMTRVIGRAKMYKLNPNSEIAKIIRKLSVEISSVDAEKIAELEKTEQETELQAEKETEQILGKSIEEDQELVM